MHLPRIEAALACRILAASAAAAAASSKMFDMIIAAAAAAATRTQWRRHMRCVLGKMAKTVEAANDAMA